MPKTGHSALDATVGIRGDMIPDLTDDREARGRFLRAALQHAEDQLAAVEDQATRISVKAAAIAEQWQAKYNEAANIYAAAADARDDCRDALDAFEGN